MNIVASNAADTPPFDREIDIEPRPYYFPFPLSRHAHVHY